jgi:hypothetical protein
VDVIGAGFGRTGTLSLKAALEALGFGPCYHMVEVFERPQDVARWQAAAEGQPVDWEALFAGYRAAVDWPTCSFYADLMQAYPAAKVLLTVRDAERWYESTRDTIYRMASGGAGRTPPPEMQPFVRMVDTLVWQRTFGGAFADKDRAIAIFRRHIDEVKARVPSERLLVFDVAEGWEPLCRFLDVPIPTDRPFPHLNDRAAFLQMVQGRRPQGGGAEPASPERSNTSP